MIQWLNFFLLAHGKHKHLPSHGDAAGCACGPAFASCAASEIEDPNTYQVRQSPSANDKHGQAQAQIMQNDEDPAISTPAAVLNYAE